MSVFKTPGSLATSAGFHDQLMDPFFREQYKARTGRDIILDGEGGGGEQKPSLYDRTLGNPDVQRLMAGIGSRMDPKGPGGYIGEPTIEMIEAKAAAAAAEKQNEQMEALIKALGNAGGEISIGEHGEIKVKKAAGNIPADDEVHRRLGTTGTTGTLKEQDQSAQPTAQPAPLEQEAMQGLMQPYIQMMDRLEKLFGGS